MNNCTVSHDMVEKLGRVLSCYDGGILVEVQRHAACGSCSARHGCGSAQLSRLSRKSPLRFSIDTMQRFQPGDQVRLGVSAANLARASVLAYGVPLFLALVGAVVGQIWLGRDVWAGLGFMAGLGVGSFWLRGHHLKQSSRYTPQLLGVVSRAENFPSSAEPFNPHRV